jgi:hypothetical protein
MTSQVDIIIKATDANTIQTAKKIQSEMTALSQKLKEAGVSQTAYNNALKQHEKAAQAAAEANKKQKFSFTELKSGIDLASQALQKMKQAYNFAKEGAQIEFTAIKFDRLAKTIGTTGDALKDKLMDATKGTMSEMAAMASATDLVSLGLVKTEKDTVRLSAVVAGLGMDMNQLVLALSNQTTMRFDQLGVAVVGFDEKVKALEATGMSAQDAFTEAFLQQAEEQLVKVGNAADTSLGKFLRFDAATEDLKNSLKLLAATASAPLLPGVTESVNDAVFRIEHFKEIWTEVYELLKAGKAGGVLSFFELQDIQDLATANVKLRENKEAIVGVAVGLEDYAGRMQEARAATAEFQMTEEQFNAGMQELSTILSGDLGEAQDDYNEKLGEYKKQLEEAKTAEDKMGIQAKIDDETAAYNERAKAVIFNIQQEAILNSAMDKDDQITAITALGQAYGIYDEATARAVGGTQNLIAEFANGTISEAEFLQGLKNINTGFQETDAEAQIATGQIVEGMYEVGMSGNAARDGVLNAKAAIVDAKDPIKHIGSRASEAGVGFTEMGAGAAGMGDRIAKEALPPVAGLKSNLNGMPAPGSMWDYYFHINVSGQVPNVPRDREYVNPGCFVAGTLVTMADGTTKPIEQIQVGDIVRSWDKTEHFHITPREEVFTFVHARVVEVFSHPAADAPALVYINGVLTATPEHLIYTSGGWKAAIRLVIGDVLLLNGEPLEVVSIETLPGFEPVYNLHTNHESHNYFANGILVHNSKQNEAGAAGGVINPRAFTVVGEGASGWSPTAEVIVGGRVIPHSKAQAWKDAGLLDGARPMMFGGDIETPGQLIGGGGYETQGQLRRNRRDRGGVPGVGITPEAESTAAGMAAATADFIAPALNQQANAMTSAVSAQIIGQGAMLKKLDKQIEILTELLGKTPSSRENLANQTYINATMT